MRGPSKPVLGVGAVIFESMGEELSVCLVRRAHPPRAGSWSLPGGKVELGETLVAAVEREIREETGLDVRVGELVEVVELIDEERHYVVLDYLCEVVAGALTQGDDAIDVAMAPLSALASYQVSAAVLRVVERALRVRARSDDER